jgi:ribosomal-protein-alanine N-acetyltransferase
MRTPPAIIVETPRLTLRVLEIDDVEALERVHGDPDVMRFSVDGAKTRDQILRYIANARECHRRTGHSQWAVVWRQAGLCIGECGIWQQDVDGIAGHEISYRLRRDFWNRGIATEAARFCRDYGFERLRLDRMISIVDPRNTASIRVAEKIGMAREKEGVFHGIAVTIYGVTSAMHQTEVYGPGAPRP